MTALSPIHSFAEELRSRTLLIFASHADAPHFREQVEMLAHFTDGLADRDVIIEKVLGKALQSEDLRRKYRVTGSFHVLLIGKDGHLAASYDDPVKPQELFSIIDAMPMRQEEMRRAGSAKERK